MRLYTRIFHAHPDHARFFFFEAMYSNLDHAVFLRRLELRVWFLNTYTRESDLPLSVLNSGFPVVVCFCAAVDLV